MTIFRQLISGNEAFALVALSVLFLAVGQVQALAQTGASGSQKGMKQFVFKREVKAPKLMVWAVISDVGNYHEVAPNIDTSTIVSGSGKGMVRHCSHGKDQWSEVCTLWDEESAYSFEVNTEAPDYPYPLSFLKGNWAVEEVSENRSRIVMTFDFRYKRGWQRVFLHPFMKSRFGKICEELLDNWEQLLK